MENNNPQTPKPQADIPAPVFVPDTIVKQKSHLDKLAEVFLPEDLDNIGNNIIHQIMIPTIMKTAGEIIHRSIDMIFKTNYTGVNTKPAETSSPQNWTGYRNAGSTSIQQMGTMQILPVRGGVYDYADVRWKSREEAQIVLNNMRSVLQSSGIVTVGMYLTLAKAKTLAEDFNYGWTDLRNVYLQDTGEPNYPYKMILPAPMPIRKQNEIINI